MAPPGLAGGDRRHPATEGAVSGPQTTPTHPPRSFAQYSCDNGRCTYTDGASGFRWDVDGWYCSQCLGARKALTRDPGVNLMDWLTEGRPG